MDSYDTTARGTGVIGATREPALRPRPGVRAAGGPPRIRGPAAPPRRDPRARADDPRRRAMVAAAPTAHGPRDRRARAPTRDRDAPATRAARATSAGCPWTARRAS